MVTLVPVPMWLIRTVDELGLSLLRGHEKGPSEEGPCWFVISDR